MNSTPRHRQRGKDTKMKIFHRMEILRKLISSSLDSFSATEREKQTQLGTS